MIMDTPIGHNCIITSIFFEGAFQFGDGVKFWGYVGTNAEKRLAEFCNSVQCHTSANYLTYCY
jgi:hypothetical protein